MSGETRLAGATDFPKGNAERCKEHVIGYWNIYDAITASWLPSYRIDRVPAARHSILPQRLCVLGMPLQKRSLQRKKVVQTKKTVRREYTNANVKELRAHSKAKTPVAKIAKLTKRSEGSLRQTALKLGIRLDHQR